MVLYTFGTLANKFIGYVYVHKTENTVKIAYIDFWGRRKDELVPIADIVPLSELAVSFTDPLYLKLKRYSTKDTLKVNLKAGIILDEKQFNKVFETYFYWLFSLLTPSVVSKSSVCLTLLM